MNYWDRKLVREQVDRKLTTLRPLAELLTDCGWIRTIRDALGMSTYELARRTGLDQSRISRIENMEMKGDLKLSTLKKVAEGLNMKFVYGFVSEKSLEDMVRDQAKKIVMKNMQRINHTMWLEHQELPDDLKEKFF